ncbi:MAG TPA: TetR/AcrR family transcriptional regulator [Candidatus Acidoferrales bacterium]|nr:TetR/AcrR family transcriptional regulator [Candidatus Acidoferrales bacterium]
MVRPAVGAGTGHRLVRRRGSQAKARETAIRAAALRIFRRKGYDAASMQEIADAVGLEKGSLYYYISSKEELLVRLFEGRGEQVLGEIDVAASRPGSPRERLRAIVHAYVLGVLRNIDPVHVYLREEYSLPPAALEQVRQTNQAMRQRFERVIEEGVRQGDFVANDPKLATLALLGTCTWVHRWFRPGGRLTDTAVADDFADRAVRMLQP